MPQPPTVDLLWDTQEKQRARNRINQRNYRQRKKEAAKREGQHVSSQGREASVGAGSAQSGSGDDCLDQASRSSSISASASASASMRRPTAPAVWPSDTSTTQTYAYNSFPCSASFSTPGMPSIFDSSTNPFPPATMTTSNTFDAPGLPGNVSDWHSQAQNYNVDPFAYFSINSSSSSGLFYPQNTVDFVGAHNSVPDTGIQLFPDAGMHGNARVAQPQHRRSSSQTINLTRSMENEQAKNMIQLAARSGQLQTVQMLLDMGIEPDVVDDRGHTPLHEAAARGHIQVVRTLVGAGCDINKRTSRGHAALDLALENGHGEVAQWLTEAASRRGTMRMARRRG